MDQFRSELEKRIRRRLAVLKPAEDAGEDPWDGEWILSHKQSAFAGLQKLPLSGFMELGFALQHPKQDWSQKVLDEAVRASIIHTFGWPIPVYLGNRDEYRPRPRTDGIVAEISLADRPSYDYWTLRRNGDFYVLRSIFEDTRTEGQVFFDTRIVRVTEVFLFCARLYNRLRVDPATNVSIFISHGGLKDRTLTAANPGRIVSERHVATEDGSSTGVSVALGSIEGRLVDLVKSVCDPLFVLFDYAEFSTRIYEDLVNAFVQGRTE